MKFAQEPWANANWQVSENKRRQFGGNSCNAQLADGQTTMAFGGNSGRILKVKCCFYYTAVSVNLVPPGLV